MTNQRVGAPEDQAQVVVVELQARHREAVVEARMELETDDHLAALRAGHPQQPVIGVQHPYLLRALRYALAGSRATLAGLEGGSSTLVPGT
ncbi:MAG: hypothetical protein M3276_07355 [Actinomycetota bacterium]|nr:hypothetical protein [Actinomycetota bacterium]